ncbi:MAG: hypothetical protein JEY99_20965 [Spirochaetales bacterium]|nr:hypothetical protein [Spirochaetales bacterium]
MSYCPRCGVEVDSDKKICPLCHTPIEKRREGENPELPNYPETEIIKVENDFKKIAEKKVLVWELLSIFLLVAVISIISIDLVTNRKLTWSPVPLSAIGAIWGGLTAIFLIGKYTILTALCNVVVLTLFLYFIDFYTGGGWWFFSIALPILILLLLLITIGTFIIKRLKSKGLNTVGLILVGISLFCIGLENILSFHLSGGLSFFWSLIVGFSLIPIAAFLGYLHYRFTPGKRFEGWFHI